VLVEQLGEAWRARAARVPIEPAPTFNDEGLILGAGTVLVRAARTGSAWLEGEQPRVLALLSAAYGRVVDLEALAHVRRAVIRWEQGEQALAAVHLALAKLGTLQAPTEASRRLFLAGWMIDAGATPGSILDALGLAEVDAQLARRFNPDQPRVPKGSGDTSGQWTDGNTVSAEQQVEAKPKEISGEKLIDAAEGALRETTDQARRLSDAAIREMIRQAARTVEEGVENAAGEAEGATLSGLSETGIEALARFAMLLPAATAFAAVLFVPSPNASRKWTNVPGRPGLRYRQLEYQPGWQVSYAGREETFQELRGDLVSASGRTVGRVLPGGALAIELAAVAPGALKDDEPRLCPVATPDRYGQGPDSAGRRYEDQIKALVNPQQPTPSGFGMALRNLVGNGNEVMFDDCEQTSGTMIEAKGPTFTDILRKELAAQSAGKKMEWNVINGLLKQSERQVQAAGVRPVRWYFADSFAADEVREIFARRGRGRERIEIRVVPAQRSGK
jgi:hypothetical protein